MDIGHGSERQTNRVNVGVVYTRLELETTELTTVPSVRTLMLASLREEKSGYTNNFFILCVSLDSVIEWKTYAINPTKLLMAMSLVAKTMIKLLITSNDLT